MTTKSNWNFGIGFVINFLFDTFLVLAVYSLGYDGKITWNGIGQAASALFGGLPSLFGIIGVLAVVALYWLLIRWLAVKNWNNHAATVSVIFLIIAGVGWWQFVKLPAGSFWLLVGYLLLVAVQTFLVWLAFVRNTTVSNTVRVWRERRRDDRHAARHGDAGVSILDNNSTI